MKLPTIRGVFGLTLAVGFVLLGHPADADCLSAVSNSGSGLCQTKAVVQAQTAQDQNCQELNAEFLLRAQWPLRQPALWVLHTNSVTPLLETDFQGQYTVLGSAMPWLWQPSGLNRAYPFGLQDGTGPTVIAISTLKAQPGQSLTIRYLSGEVDVGGIFPPADANGVASPYSYGGDGSSGQPFPSQYMQPYPINLGALVAVFTDNMGSIIDRPFSVGDGPVSRTIPSGACQLQLGINDDIYGDTNGPANTGSFIIAVSVTALDETMPDDGKK